jgi:predicted  nucleic acid-binding Zn-ribbon protein
MQVREAFKKGVNDCEAAIAALRTRLQEAEYRIAENSDDIVDLENDTKELKTKLEEKELVVPEWPEAVKKRH